MAGFRMTMIVIGKSPVLNSTKTIITLKGNNSAGVDSLFSLTTFTAAQAAAFTLGDTKLVYVYPTTDQAAVEAAAGVTPVHNKD